MPKENEVTNHPCHLLSLPSAKRFWCRHCMTVFEDAITRWRHSRLCRYGAVNNFMKRRELEAKALQNTTALISDEARLEQSIQMCDLASTSTQSETFLNKQTQILSGPDFFTCFICHQKFVSMEEMRVHVKYPCNSSRIITSVPHPKHSVPVYVESLPGQTHHWQPTSHHEVFQFHTHNPQHNSAEISYDNEVQSQQELESQYESPSVSFDHKVNISDGITPTNIYVNEQGETVIEVENLDLNSEGGELSLAHFLAQLSQQWIVFDKSRSAELQAAHEVTVTETSLNNLYSTSENYQNLSSKIEEEEQSTAEDAANTLAQLAGLRSFARTGERKVSDGTSMQSQAQTVHNTNYSNSVPGPSKRSALNAQSQINKQYDNDCSGRPSFKEHSINMPWQTSLQQSSISVAQFCTNDQLKHEAVEDEIQFYTDSSSVTYITDPDSHHQIHVEADETLRRDYLKHHDADVNKKTLIINTSLACTSE